MSCDNQSLLKNTEHFKLFCSLKYEDIIPLSLYRSEITGVTVCIAEVDGPFIDGDFNIVTETCDNDGLPYAVQHLIFTGSKDYPYYNILKLWAAKGLASDIAVNIFHDRTCFSMRAAGSEGFLNLMPMYLDHILFPSLEDSAYLTEVHHITGKGNHGGVLYCKTQIQERTSDYIIKKKLLRALYPGYCGYNSVVIGTTKNLRESTNNEKVKQFHHKFYRSENLTILITGKIQPDQIFQALLPLEEKIMSKQRKDIFERPWQTPIKLLKKSADVEVFFPTDKETYGEVHVAWRGPSTITQINDYCGCFLLLSYLTETSSNPLRKEFGEIVDDVLITWFTNHWSDPYLDIIFKNVPVEQIDLITKKSIHKVLRNVCTDGINIETMKTIIHKLSFNLRFDVENTPHINLSAFLLNPVIYKNTTNWKKRINMLRALEKLKTKSKPYFSTLLKKYFVDAPMVVVKGKPSLDMYLKLQDRETNVIEQNKTLSQKCLKQKEKELQEAIKKQNKPIPYTDLWKVPMPGIDSITFHHIQRYNTETAKQHPKLNVKKLPLFTYLDDVDTNFFYLQIIMDTSSISPENKFYIPLLMNVITESPIKREDHLIPYEKIKDLLCADTIQIHSHTDINTLGHIPHSMSLMFQAELHNYEKNVQWCKEFLYDTLLTADNIKINATSITQSLYDYILRKETLAEILMTTLLYTNDNNRFTYNLFRQHKFFTNVQELITTDVGQTKVMAEIESVRQTLTSPKNMFVYMAVNVNKLTKQIPDVFAPWNNCFSNCINLEKPKVNIISNSKVLTPSTSFTYNGCIMGLEKIDSSVLLQACPCINDFQHSDLPALEVCLTYLKQQGGPIYQERQKRQALSGHIEFSKTVDDGYLHLKFISPTNIVNAYKKLQTIVETHLAKTKWNSYLYENAKSSVILNYINNVQTIKHVINASLTSYCTNLSHDYDYEMVRRVSAVTIDDMSRVTTQYIKPLFDPKQCKIAIVCNNDKFAEIKEAFEKMKFNFNVFKSLHELRDYVDNRTTK